MRQNDLSWALRIDEATTGEASNLAPLSWGEPLVYYQSLAAAILTASLWACIVWICNFLVPWHKVMLNRNAIAHLLDLSTWWAD